MPYGYTRRYRTMQATDTHRASSSAVGAAYQTPQMPNTLGNSKMQPDSNTRVRKNDRNAETRPFPNAVNSAEANMLHPLHR